MEIINRRETLLLSEYNLRFMQKKVFISFTMSDKKLAEKIHDFILKRFKGDIEVYLSSKNMLGGQVWKEEIKENLEKSDAIISLMTPSSLSKPWIYIEWAAFWLASRPFYILKTDRVSKEELINPMQDRNYATVNDLNSFKGFIEHLSETLFGEDYVAPLNKVEPFIIQVNQVLAEMAEDELKVLTQGLNEDLSNLPGENSKKVEIALELLRTGQTDRLKEVFKRIDDDSVKIKLFNNIFKIDKDIAVMLIKEAESNVLKAKVVNVLIDKQKTELETIKAVIKSINSDIGLRRIGTYMWEHNLEESELFHFIIDNFNYNTVLKRWGSQFIEQRKIDSPTFSYLVTKLVNNHSKLSKDLGLDLISANYQRHSTFNIVITGLQKRNKKESVQELLESLKLKDPDLYKHYKNLFDADANEE